MEAWIRGTLESIDVFSGKVLLQLVRSGFPGHNRQNQLSPPGAVSYPLTNVSGLPFLTNRKHKRMLTFRQAKNPSRADRTREYISLPYIDLALGNTYLHVDGFLWAGGQGELYFFLFWCFCQPEETRIHTVVRRLKFRSSLNQVDSTATPTDHNLPFLLEVSASVVDACRPNGDRYRRNPRALCYYIAYALP